MNKNYKTPPVELAGQALRNYVQMLEEKVARYERIMQCCPRFRAEKAQETPPPPIEWIEPYHDEELEDGLEESDFKDDLEDDWDGLEESDFKDDWEDDWDGLEESDFEDDLEDDWDGLEESDFKDDWEDDDLDDDDLEADGIENPPSDGAYSEAVLQAFPHVRTIHRLVARRR